jgi:hypothetical protein
MLQATFLAKVTNFLDIFIGVFSLSSWSKLVPTTLALGQWFLNLLPNQEGAAQWAAPA